MSGTCFYILLWCDLCISVLRVPEIFPLLDCCICMFYHYTGYDVSIGGPTRKTCAATLGTLVGVVLQGFLPGVSARHQEFPDTMFRILRP